MSKTGRMSSKEFAERLFKAITGSILPPETVETPEEYVILVGNPSDGYKIYGAFDTFEDADEWIRHNDAVFMMDTWIMPLMNVKKDEEEVKYE